MRVCAKNILENVKEAERTIGPRISNLAPSSRIQKSRLVALISIERILGPKPRHSDYRNDLAPQWIHFLYHKRKTCSLKAKQRNKTDILIWFCKSGKHRKRRNSVNLLAQIENISTSRITAVGVFCRLHIDSLNGIIRLNREADQWCPDV